MQKSKIFVLNIALLSILISGCSIAPTGKAQEIADNQCPDLSGVYTPRVVYVQNGINQNEPEPKKYISEKNGFNPAMLALYMPPVEWNGFMSQEDEVKMNQFYDLFRKGILQIDSDDIYFQVIRIGITNYRTDIFKKSDRSLLVSFNSKYPVNTCQDNKIVYKYTMRNSITDDMIPVIGRIHRQVTLYVDKEGNLHNDFIERSYKVPFVLLIPVWFKTSKFTDSTVAEKYVP